MQIHQIKPKTKNKKSKRVGRGGKRGTYSGRGQKGQKARAGRKIRPQMRDAVKKIPKKRGYRFNPANKDFFAIVNLSDINKRFEESEKITPESLFKKKLIKRTKKRLPKVKILGHGKLTKKVIISGCEFSKSAKSKIKDE